MLSTYNCYNIHNTCQSSCYYKAQRTHDYILLWYFEPETFCYYNILCRTERKPHLGPYRMVYNDNTQELLFRMITNNNSYYVGRDE